jgi:serralysin
MPSVVLPELQGIKIISLSGSNRIDGLLTAFGWAGDSITYSFPDSANDFHYTGERDTFSAVGANIESTARFALDKDFGSTANDGFSIEGFTRLSVTEGTDAASTIRYGHTDDAGATAFGYFPGWGELHGDIWVGNDIDDSGHSFEDQVQGDWTFAALLHETGHAFGLKHGHVSSEQFPTLDLAYDTPEYTVMTYRSFEGDEPIGPVIEEFGYAQTFMMSDIAALQHMYGANFSVNSGRTVYSWSPDSGNTLVNGKVGLQPGGDAIFATIWDGGGKHDTYDLSAYQSDLSLDLRPGQHCVFSEDQLSDLGYFLKPGVHMARGNIFNALLYREDRRSLIEDAIGGSGDDSLVGNQGRNVLTGNSGNDFLIGMTGADRYVGGAGNDVFFHSSGEGVDTVVDFTDGQDKIDLADFSFARYDDVKALMTDSDAGVTITFATGDVIILLDADFNKMDETDFSL